jgi:GlpG protein
VRQIGTLPRTLDPRVLGDHLLAQGMKARFDEQPDGWLVWIYNEDQLEKARAELQAYLDRPHDPRYAASARSAQEVRTREKKLDRAYQKNFRDVTDQWSGVRFRRRPLTIFLVAASVAVFLLEQSPTGSKVVESLLLSTPVPGPEGGLTNDGLRHVLRGELWRLVTPIFLHFSPLHILFNCWATIALGTIIEARRGTARLLILVLVSAVVSNLGQFYIAEQMRPGVPHLFGGLSGVVYALFGYAWMKSQYEPEQGMILHPNSVTMMLMWLVLCMTGALGPIANGAHVVGLVVGVVFGVCRF